MIKGLISVIVPVYKTEAFLIECVGSIRAQTYDNLEIILVDDGSPDDCGDICDRLAKEDDRIKVIHKKNGGPAGARNAGLNIAKGEFIAFADSDDTIDPDMYIRMYETIIEEEADICVCGIKMIYDGYVRVLNVPDNKKISPKEFWETYISDIRAYHVLLSSPCNKLIKKSILTDTDKETDIQFPTDVRFAEDGYFCTDCVEAAKNGITFVGFAPYNYSQVNNPVSVTKVESYMLVNLLMDYIQVAVQRALPQRANEIEKLIAYQKQVNEVIAVHLAITNKIKQPSRVSWSTVATILRQSTNREEKFSAVMMYFLPPPLYRAVFMLYCKLSKSQ